MIRTTLIALAAVCGLQAQTTNPLIAEGKRTYTGLKNNLTKMVEKVSDDFYSYQPVPEIRTFAALMGHVADTQLSFCSSVRGERKAGTAGKMTAKADLVKAMAESFAECDAAWDSITDANANEPVGGANAKGPGRSKLGTLIYMTAHSDEEYGYASMYLRMKGIVPPSSDNQGMKKGD
jgi:hypothetical protein